MTGDRVPLSVLDVVPVPSGADPSSALANTVDLARTADDLGYARYWFAEHHLHPGMAGTSPAVLTALAAAATNRIRVGSGGIQGGYRTALSVVEEFGLLDAAFPGRIDLGIGPPDGGAALGAGSPPPTGPGSGRPRAAYRTAEGLLIPERPSRNGSTDSPRATLTSDLLLPDGAEPTRYAELVEDVVGLLAGTYRDADGLDPHPVPGSGTGVEVWAIGSGDGEIASVAGAQGLRFAADYHASPATVLEAVDDYRVAFVPSAGLERPYLAVTVDVVVGPDDDTANELAAGYALWVHSFRSGRGAMPYPSPEEAGRHHWTEDQRNLIRDRTDTQLVGSARSVIAQLEWLHQATGADELMVTTTTHQHQDRVRSYRLLAEAWSEDRADPPVPRMHYPTPVRDRPGVLPSTRTR